MRAWCKKFPLRVTGQLSAGSDVTWGHARCHGHVMLTMGSTTR